MKDILLTLACVAFIGLTAFAASKIAAFFYRYNYKTRFITQKMKSAADDIEYLFWRRELSYHYLCLIPFVNRGNVKKVYRRFHNGSDLPAIKSKPEQVSLDFHIVAPSAIAMCLCVICFSGMSWAWFTSSSNVSTASIKTSSYTLEKTVTPITAEGEEAAAALTPDADGVYTTTDDKGVTITLTATGDATTGYCEIEITTPAADENTESTTDKYYTAQIAKGAELSFKVNCPTGVKIKLTPQWGTCSLTENIISDGDTIGDYTPAETSEHTHEYTWAVDETDKTTHIGTCTVEGCTENTASHTAAWSSWTQTETTHTRTCTVEGCTLTETANHTFGETDSNGYQTCTECGYKKQVAASAETAPTDDNTTSDGGQSTATDGGSAGGGSSAEGTGTGQETTPAGGGDTSADTSGGSGASSGGSSGGDSSGQQQSDETDQTTAPSDGNSADQTPAE